MTFDEYINSLDKLQNRLNYNLKFYDIYQNKMTQPYIDYQYKLAEGLLPLMNMQTRLIEAYRPINSMLDRYSNIVSTLAPSTVNLFNRHQDIFSKVLSFDTHLIESNISKTASDTINKISLNAIIELDNYDYPEEFNDTKDSIAEISSSDTSLTWEQFLTIVTFIITIIMFIQSQMPNKQLTNIENYLTQIIEIETNELHLLENKDFE